MEQNFQTSFIPKKPLVKTRAVASKPMSIVTLVALFVLFAVVLAGIGLYFYKASLNQSLVKMENDLNLARNRFEDNKISQLEILDKRLQASSEVLARHISVSPIFKNLQDTTMKTVRYNKFDYSIGGGDKPDEIKVLLSGQATGYRSIALQSDILSKNKFFIDPVFSNLSLDERGNVNFDLSFAVDPNLVNYNKSLPVVGSSNPVTITPPAETKVEIQN